MTAENKPEDYARKFNGAIRNLDVAHMYLETLVARSAVPHFFESTDAETRDRIFWLDATIQAKIEKLYGLSTELELLLYEATAQNDLARQRGEEMEASRKRDGHVGN